MRHKTLRTLTALALLTALFLPLQAESAAIPFHKFRLLQEGMSEGEVIMRVGPPDRETLINNQFQYKKIWYYIPDGSYSGDWLTTITIDANGRVIEIEREKP